MEILIEKAKNNDKNAKEEIIKMYYPLIVKESKRVFLKNRSFEDLVQIGIISLLKAINLFDLTRGSKSFSSYALWSVKNGFITLIRSEAKYSDEISLNSPIPTSPDNEIVESIIDENVDIENQVTNSIINNKVLSALNNLDYEEKDIIIFLYIANTLPNLSKYSRSRNKDYYYCSCLKKRALTKLKHILKEYK
ncbi:sigma-70 family RNA polymerase sigma factor [Clostridium sp. AL.422]|uniref:sigma-70 family RNA polymerase sigma factor n=1 Tax=Clostridium TaxID=1485 RepID=UPI00293DD0BF|nr:MULTISPECIES: sigma-70 family RNA polymerase sigma factor [unclassified Clostridium]MDV4150316.1 sigma-70 family RNA polymerase sigma factor [Clostridium sp. AL.422]